MMNELKILLTNFAKGLVHIVHNEQGEFYNFFHFRAFENSSSLDFT